MSTGAGNDERGAGWPWLRALSVGLLFFTVPHALEDFLLGEPLKRGAPPMAVALVVATLVAAQAVGLQWLAQGRRAGLLAHVVIGLIWAGAAGAAQVPELVAPGTLRSGVPSVVAVVGMIVIGMTVGLWALAELVLKKPR
jgi:hypothetical protein